MAWEINIYGMILGLIVLVPLGLKWDIDRTITIVSAICIGFMSGFIIHGVSAFWEPGLLLQTLLQISVIVGTAGMLLMWRFFRDPERNPPIGENGILSPADGKIIYVKEAERGEVPFSEKKGRRFLLHEFVQSDILPPAGTLIGISMNFLDVHVNRTPIGGRIEALRHIRGRFLSLRREDAIVENERQLTVINNGRFRVGVVQIASRLVRNIVAYKREGQQVRRGERIGMIRFGSQVDLYVPDACAIRVNVTVGQKVKAGVSIIATYATIPEAGDTDRTHR
jgi:phosphatidylserine decarboxylase